MSSRNRPMKASDVFSQTTFFLGKTSDFSKGFPKIEHASVVVIEKGEGASGREYHYHEGNLGEYIDCHNPRCYNGGVRIGEILRFMEENGTTEAEYDEWCQGYEGSPKGRKNYGPCDNTFHIKVTVSYRSKS